MHPNDSRVTQTHTSLQKIIQIDDPNVQIHIRQRIKLKLIEDAQLLLERKRKQQEKKERVKKVQEEMQKHREEKLKQILEKKNKSDQVISKNKDSINKKIKHQQEYFQQVLNKHQKKSKQQVETAIGRQKQLKRELSKSLHRPQLNRNNSGSSSTLDATFHNSRYMNQYKYQKLSQQLVLKTKKAEQNHEKYNQLIVDRMRQKSENITQAQQKVVNMTIEEQRENLKKWGKKIESIEYVHQSIRTQREKKLIERRESFKYKIDKCNQNLRNLSYRQQQKYDDLQTKFNRKLQPKEWRDPRLEKYYKLWQGNNKQIEYKRDEDANKILHKHQQITEQNRVYKSRKEKLIQTMKLI